MTDHNFTNLPALDLLGMLYSAPLGEPFLFGTRAANAPKNFLKKVLDKAVRMVYNFAAINGLFVGFALLYGQPEEQLKQLHPTKSN